VRGGNGKPTFVRTAARKKSLGTVCLPGLFSSGLIKLYARASKFLSSFGFGQKYNENIASIAAQVAVYIGLAGVSRTSTSPSPSTASSSSPSLVIRNDDLEWVEDST